MKNLKLNQIEQVKQIKSWFLPNFHGNTKKVGGLLIADFKEIVAKKRSREILKQIGKLSNIQIVKNLISEPFKNTPYFKILIEGNSGIYLASPIYLHSDYNKTRLFDKTASNLKLMNLFNSIVKK